LLGGILLTVVGLSSIAEQFWCEMRVDLERKYLSEKTQAMRRGTEIHEEFLREFCDVRYVHCRTVGDWLHNFFLDLLLGVYKFVDVGEMRELPVFFDYNSVIIMGRVDQIVKIGGKTKVVENKTRVRPFRPTPEQIYRDRMQGMLYWYGLNRMRKGELSLRALLEEFGSHDSNLFNFSQEYLMDLPEMIRESHGKNPYEAIFSLGEKAREKLVEIPKLSKQIELVYVYQKNREEVYRERYSFNSNLFKEKIEWALEYRLGKREPIPVNERNQWKCDFCKHIDKCTAYKH